VSYAAIWTQVFERFEYAEIRTQLTSVFGADDRFMEIAGGQFLEGRPFTLAERRSGAPVVVLEREMADRLFGSHSPLDRVIRIGGRPFRVVGIWQKPENVFQPPGSEWSAIVPFEAARQAFRYDETNSLVIAVKPKVGVSVETAIDATTVLLRRMRGLRPGEPSTFDVITSDQILSIFNRLTSAFFLVMIVLSSVALMVGGIGVMAIMMVSVTSRTREIGVRKAMGATRREILWQFLVEAATLTLVGGAIGILVGLGAGQVLKGIMGFDTGVPIWSAVVATTVSIVVGLVFGLLPANRAARLDPVEALRYE
jgi:putative ABC transport system permease protein